MPIQKIPGRQIQDESVTGDKIKNYNIDTDDIRNESILSSDIKNGAIANVDIADEAIDSTKIKDGTITTIDLINNAINSEKILDGTITNVDISPTAQIDINKINWSQIDFQWFVDNVVWPEAPYYQTSPLECKYTNSALQYNHAYINNWYLYHKVQFNFLNYMVASGGSSNARVRVALYDVNGNLLYMSGELSAYNGTFKVPVPSQWLYPGFYYSAVICSSGSVKFITADNYPSAVIPQKGRFYTGSPLWLPNKLNFSDIDTTSDKQPWLMFSKI